MSIPLPRLFAAVLAMFALGVSAACSDSDSGSGSTSAAGESSGDDGEDDGDSAEPSGEGHATITIGGETWSFDSVRCGIGEEETGVPGAELNMSATDGTIALYVAAEGEGSYIELADLETMDDGGLNYTTTGIGTPVPRIDVNDRSFSATADFYAYTETGELDGPVEGTVTGTCP